MLAWRTKRIFQTDNQTTINCKSVPLDHYIILKMLTNLRHSIEIQWFGVLTRMGAKLGIPVSKLRVFFIYSTFATAGVFFLIYLGLAFTLWIKDMFITRRPSVFDL